MSNLSHQFDGAMQAHEDMQRRRFARKKGVSGFIGNGYWYAEYPYRVGTMLSGSMTQTQSSQYEGTSQTPDQNAGETAGDSSGMGEGGTGAGYVGGLG